MTSSALSLYGDRSKVDFPPVRLRSEIVIPARLASRRLPEKLLLRETGKTVLQHTFESASRATRPNRMTIAVDSDRLAGVVTQFGGDAVLTDPALCSGTDRVAAVAKVRESTDIFVNVQGDEPEITAQAIDLVVELLERNPTAEIATLATPIREQETLENPACVKVVCDQQQRAMYFSRSPIPHARSWDYEMLNQEPPIFLQHIGLYAYRRNFLCNLEDLPISRYESIEKLEQLRFLEAGAHIVVGRIDDATKGIDTQEDYCAFVQRYNASLRIH